MEISKSHRMSRGRIGIGTRSNDNTQDQEHPYQSLTENSQRNQREKESQPLEELQRYVDFQRLLSKRISDDLNLEETSNSIEPLVFPSREWHNENLDYLYPKQKFRLRQSVLIPGKNSEDGSPGWTRAYAPSLIDFGINQDTFLQFIDTFNEMIKQDSSALDISNLPKFENDIECPEITAASSSSGWKNQNMQHSAISFLRLANNQLFNPQGLCAMIIDPSPDNRPTSPINTKMPHREISRPHFLSPHLTSMTPLIYFEENNSRSEATQIHHRSVRKPRRQSESRAKELTADTLKSASISHRVSRKHLTGAIKGILTRPGKAERGFMERVKAKDSESRPKGFDHKGLNMGMRYLMIIEKPADRNWTDTHPSTGEEAAKSDDPPPEYHRNIVRRRQESQSRKEYCIPTL